MLYPNELLVRDAREIYFSRSGFNEKSYSETWIKLPVWKWHFYLPNFSARKKVLPLHDIDHVLTEYETDWKGEWQISAYEIGTGCGRYWAGWFINSQGILVGGIFYPRESVRAFARGRRSIGIYGYDSHLAILSEKVGALRAKLLFPPELVTVSTSDIVLFYASFVAAAIFHFSPFLILAKIFFF